jgi:hypothetical protein
MILMPARHLICQVRCVISLALVLCITGCSQSESSQPIQLPTSSGSTSISPSGTLTAAEKANAEIKSDVKRYNVILLEGALSDNPTFDYGQIAMGAVLEDIRQSLTNQHVIQNKFSGTTSIVSSTVDSVTLDSKPPKAMASVCVNDATTITNISGQIISRPSGKSSWEMEMTKVGNHWLVSKRKILEKNTGQCQN